MKKILKTTAILLILAGSFACERNDENQNLQDLEKYYIIGYDPCNGLSISGKNGEAGGYYIASEDLKDTLLTYNFPKNIFAFPAEIFYSSTSSPVWFPVSYQRTFKIQLNYLITSEEEKIYPVCNGMVFVQNINATQIIIKSATKTN